MNALFLGLALALPCPLFAQGIEALRADAGRRFDGDAAAPAAVEAFSPASDDAPSISLSELVERLSRDPKAIDDLVEVIRKNAPSLGQGWPGLESADGAVKEKLVRAIQRSDKSFLDSFPTMSLQEIKVLIAAYGRNQSEAPPQDPDPASEELALPGKPHDAPPGAFMEDWGHGLYRGDLPRKGLDTAYADNVAVAGALNRLALNEPGRPPAYTLTVAGRSFTSVGAFLESLLQSGHAISAADMRYFANFAGLWLKDQDRLLSVVAPLYVDTGERLPGGRELVVPVSHSELELRLRGASVNADVIYYFGVGGTAKFYPSVGAAKPWVGGRAVRTWRGEEAVTLAERAATTRRELRLKAAKYGLPLGGYGPLGVCNDVEAMITGIAIYPEIRDMRYYNDGMEMDAWAKSLPVDGAGAPPDPRRVYDSLPVDDPAQVEIPQVKEAIRELKSSVPVD